jgi:hypothetical protein
MRTRTADPLPWFRDAMVPVGDTAVLVLGADPLEGHQLVVMGIPSGEVSRSVRTADLLTEWMGCPVDATHPRYAAVTGTPTYVVPWSRLEGSDRQTPMGLPAVRLGRSHYGCSGLVSAHCRES